MNTSEVALLPLIIFSVSLAVLNCTHHSKIPDPEPMPESKSFSGLWYSKQFEHMYLEHNGSHVTGVYSYKEGGRLRGKVQGNLLLFEWKEPRTGNKPAMEGRGYLRLVATEKGPRLIGKWGYDNRRVGGGPWRAEYLRALEPEDPDTIGEINDG